VWDFAFLCRWHSWAIAIAGGVAICIALLTPLETDADWSRRYRCDVSQDTPNSADSTAALTCVGGLQARTETNKAKVEDTYKVLERRLDHYESELTALRTNLWLQLLFIIVGIYVLVRAPADLKIPIMGLRVPLPWLQIAIPAALLYLNITLGFLLDHLIQQRYFLWNEVLALEGGQGRSIHSFALLLDDRWIMDTWFAEYHPQLMSNGWVDGFHWVGKLLLGLFACFFGIQQGTLLALLARPGVFGKTIGAAIFLFVLILLAANQLAFAIQGGNATTWFQLAAMGFSLLAFVVLHERARRLDGRPASV